MAEKDLLAALEASLKKCPTHNRYGCSCWEADQEADTSGQPERTDDGPNGPDAEDNDEH